MNNELVNHVQKVMDAIENTPCEYKVVFNITKEGDITATVELFGNTTAFTEHRELKRS